MLTMSSHRIMSLLTFWLVAFLLGYVFASMGVVLIGAERTYHRVTLAQLATTRHTHVCVKGPVTYVRKQRDGDYHVTLDDGRTKVVLELIPAIPIVPPRKGQRVEACGISRFDKHHKWAEVHPVERLEVLR